MNHTNHEGGDVLNSLPHEIEADEKNDCLPENLTEHISAVKNAINKLDVRDVDNALRKIVVLGGKYLDLRNYYSALHYLVKTYTSYQYHSRPNQANIRFIEILNRLLHSGVDINDTDIHKQTALHLLVAKSGHSDIIKVLLEAGADVSIRDSLSQTVLHKAAFCGCYYNCRALLDGGANVQDTDISGFTPLHVACKRKKNSAVIALLLQYGSDVSHEGRSKGGQSLTPLHIACRYGDEDNVVCLLRAGARVNNLSASGISAVHMAAAHDITGRIIPHLLKHRADVHCIDDLHGETALHKAVKNNMFENVRALIKGRASPNMCDCHMENCLHVAATSTTDIQIWTLLMKAGATPHAPNLQALTPLDKALKLRNFIGVNVMRQFDKQSSGLVVSSPKLAPSPRILRKTIQF